MDLIIWSCYLVTLRNLCFAGEWVNFLLFSPRYLPPRAQSRFLSAAAKEEKNFLTIARQSDVQITWIAHTMNGRDWKTKLQTLDGQGDIFIPAQGAPKWRKVPVIPMSIQNNGQRWRHLQIKTRGQLKHIALQMLTRDSTWLFGHFDA